MRKAVEAMRGRHITVIELLRPRRRLRRDCAERVGSAEPQVEGVIYLTPDGDGYILYATRPAPAATAVVAAVS